MADTAAPEMGKTTATETAATTPQTETPAEMVTVTKAEHERILKALKDANTEAAKHRKALEDKTRGEMSEVEKLKAELDAERSERMTALREVLAAKYNLPDALAKRLLGTTREELEADAVALAASLPKLAVKSPGPVGGNPASKPVLTFEQLRGMSAAEIRKLPKDLVDEVLSKGASKP